MMYISIIAVIAFAFAITFAADDAEAQGGGVATIFPSYVVAGDYYSFTITYTVPEGGFNNSGGSNPGWSVTIPSVEEFAEWNGTTDPWSLPQTSDAFDFGFVTVEGAHKNDANITIDGRNVTIDYNGDSGFPAHDEDLVLRYGNLLYRSQVQLHNELDVEFHVEVDEAGDGTYEEIADHPNADVVPGDPDKIIVTVIPEQIFDPNPYVSPKQIHTNSTGAKNPPPNDKISGVDFKVEIRLTDRYLNLITEEKGDDELDLQWGSVDDPPDAVPGKSPAPCSDSPRVMDWFSDWYDFYEPGPFPYNKTDIAVQFENGKGIRYDADFVKYDYFWMTLYKVETDVSLYVKNNQLYEWNTGQFNTLSPFEETPLDFYYGSCGYNQSGSWIINPYTPIHIDQLDANITDYTIQYRVWYNGSWSSWFNGTANENVTFNMSSVGMGGDCLHYIEYRSYDKYCNFGEIKNETVYVDGTDPVSTASYYGTWIEGDGFWWVDYDSYFTLSCQDYADCPKVAGNLYTLWRYEYDNVSYPNASAADYEIDGVYYYIYTEENIGFDRPHRLLPERGPGLQRRGRAQGRHACRWHCPRIQLGFGR
jgi:hypothetical protein